jgi:hypothetical protein
MSNQIEGAFMVLCRFRNGFGFDIEYNSELCYIGVNQETEDEYLLAFEGIVIKLPLIQIHIGSMEEQCKLP